ncbi:hypothetical protein SDC9_153528 [bioreactor metagenome]|uniref:Uncharacterized protein n=1 Tax=bioreactor metagenome TaxID=1076179 RepID=A0A645EYF0_9ZZZZ
MVSVPWRAGAALREERAEHLDEHQHDGDPQRLRDGQRQQRDRHPRRLGGDDRPEVEADRAPAGDIRPPGPGPADQQGETHDDVPQDDGPVVEVRGLERVVHRWDPEREHHHADHDRHRHQPESPVVVVVRGGEPGVVDPGPDDPEAGEAEADQRGGEVTLGQVVRELFAAQPERDGEGQVEQQLQG